MSKKVKGSKHSEGREEPAKEKRSVDRKQRIIMKINAVSVSDSNT